MSQERLSALNILCIESDKLKQITFDELLHDFALTKARKKTFIAYSLTLFDACSYFLCPLNKLNKYCNGCLIKEIKIESKTVLTKFLFF